MPKWLTDIFIIILGALLVFFCGWLSGRLKLKSWHLAASLGAGLLIILAGGLLGFFPLIVLGLVLFTFPLAAWGYRGLLLLQARRESKG